MRKTKAQNGITLIALIITIIVLLILAVVTIGAVQEDGIIGKAKYARDEYRKAQDKENSILQGYLDQLNDNTLYGNSGVGNTDNEKVESETGVERGVKVTGSNATFIQKINGENYTAIIPVGFCVVKDAVGDSNSIKRGLVISDVADDDLENSKKGNQFVWIPVEDYSKFHLIEGYRGKSLASTLSDEWLQLREAGDSVNAGSPMSNNVAGTTESIAMYNSVKENKGFYIARFEAGIDAKDESGNPINNYQLETKTVANGTVKPLSKKGIGVWESIPWGGTYNDIASDGLPGNDNADGAVKVARSMYTKNNECGVTSTLCYGVQWDAVMNFIEPNYYKQDGTLTGFVANSNGKGNYSGWSGGLALTGAYEQNHIFDLAGNVYEWTMESSICHEVRANRGGDWGGSGSFSPASSRDVTSIDSGGWLNRFPCSFIFVGLSIVKTKI